MNKTTIREKLALISLVPLITMLVITVVLVWGEMNNRIQATHDAMLIEANNLAQLVAKSYPSLSTEQVSAINPTLKQAEIQSSKTSATSSIVERQGFYFGSAKIDANWQVVVRQPVLTLGSVLQSHAGVLAAFAVIIVITLSLMGLFSRYIVNTLAHMRHITDQASGNDLRVRLNFPKGRDDLGQLGDHIDELIATRQRVVKSLLEVCRKLQEQAEVLLSNANSSNQLSVDQRQHLDSLATAMEEMTVTVNDVTNHASNTSEETQSASKDAEDGLSQIRSTIDTIEQLANDVQSASTAVSEVNANAAKIDAVVTTINSISEQTNLLALNAAIEAARAGHHGRGFAVVADEVRSLASRTQAATIEIQQMIEELQSGTGELEKLMHSTTTRAEQGQELVAKTGEGLQQIALHSEKIFNMNDHIATAANQQSEVMTDISGNLMKVRNQSHDAEQAANDSVSASQSVDTIVGDLALQLSRLKI